MEKKPKIVVLDAATLYPSDDFRWTAFKSFADIEVYDRTSASEIVNHINDAQMVLTNKVPVTALTVSQCPNLKYIGVLATGYNIIDIAACHQAGITVCNVPAYSTASVAQTAITLLLTLTSRLEYYGEENRKGRWSHCADFTYRDFDWHELAGKTFSVVGFGNTGKATAAIAAALGMRVAVYTSKSQEELPAGYVKMDMDTLFREADVLSLHCPLTEDTYHLVNSSRLSIMKPTAVIINTSRGPVIDEEALADALKTGKIAGAGLDVLTHEPPEADNPLLKLDNCLISQHLAWASAEARQRLFDTALMEAKAFIDGNPYNVI